MIIRIDGSMVPNIHDGIIDNKVLKYVVEKAVHNNLDRYDNLYSYYMGKNNCAVDKDKVLVNANYAKYIVDIIQGYFLGEPIKYDNNTICSKNKKTSSPFNDWSVQAKLNKEGAVVRHNEQYELEQTSIDISPIVDTFSHQNISGIDDKIGRSLGIFGEACEVLYSSSDQSPEPRSAVYLPKNCVLVQDNTVEHKDMFALTIDRREDINHNEYYAITVITDMFEQDYKSTDINNFVFSKINETREHFFGEVPVIVYENNDERQGDFEQAISLIDARNDLLSDRLTDKKKFVKSLLAMYGITLEEGSIKVVAEEQFLDGIPLDARIEYIQKVFDEASLKILDDTLVNDIHKTTMAIDLSDEQFAGNSTGVALKMKLFCMTSLVKSKMRRMETGLKKRFRLYNNWLSFKGEMTSVSVDDIDIVFTVSIPVDEQAVVSTVKSLKGLVDDQTLLSQLWFIRDPAEALENIKKQKEEEQKAYLDSFGVNKNADTLNTKSEDEKRIG